MTDVPRRSYPLVVAPPGGFEDAVRRGRSLRRRRAGGSSGVALVLVGALGYAVLNPSSGIDRLDPTTDDRREATAPAPDGYVSQSPAPTAAPSSNVRPGANPTPGTGGITDVRPTVGATSVVVPPTRKPGGNPTTRRYAARNGIVRDEATTNTDTNCITAQDLEWCARANVDTTRAADGIYTLEYHLCRQVDTAAKTITFPYRQEVEFSATDIANSDTVWTYSLGQTQVSEPEEYTFPGSSCVRWHVEWNGLDDFGYMPVGGEYRLTARGLANEPLPQATQTFTHQ